MMVVQQFRRHACHFQPPIGVADALAARAGMPAVAVAG
jgi:hypothetical protein